MFGKFIWISVSVKNFVPFLLGRENSFEEHRQRLKIKN